MQKLEITLGAPGSTFLLLVERMRERCSQVLPKRYHFSVCTKVLEIQGEL